MISVRAAVRTKQPRIQVFDTQRSKDDHITAFQILSDVMRAVDLEVFYRNIAILISGIEVESVLKA